MFETESKEYADKYENNRGSLEWWSLRNSYQVGAAFGYDKAIKEMQGNGLALQSDMDRTIEQNLKLKAKIEKMKCCENCKYNSYWGDELHCNYGLKEALQEDKLIECKKMDKWELKQ